MVLANVTLYVHCKLTMQYRKQRTVPGNRNHINIELPTEATAKIDSTSNSKRNNDNEEVDILHFFK